MTSFNGLMSQMVSVDKCFSRRAQGLSLKSFGSTDTNFSLFRALHCMAPDGHLE